MLYGRRRSVETFTSQGRTVVGRHCTKVRGGVFTLPEQLLHFLQPGACRCGAQIAHWRYCDTKNNTMSELDFRAIGRCGSICVLCLTTHSSKKQNICQHGRWALIGKSSSLTGLLRSSISACARFPHSESRRQLWRKSRSFGLRLSYGRNSI